MKAQPDADKTLNMILSRLDDMKAEETVTIDLRGKSAFSDYMIVTTGRANRHVGAIAENVTKALKENGIKGIHVEGLPNCDWVLIDSGDVVVHVFRPEVREFYNLERLWTQNPAARGDLSLRPMRIGWSACRLRARARARMPENALQKQNSCASSWSQSAG